ncbi:MerR family DNA-binding protein [Shewanella mesophila]|uniref:MerR family DNA-binding protein n=1 Tax=Shewanella mesophila TaxID=2864208 RepID=UPI001C659A0B|nr:MerR family DNA-binding protein [Shewanella mesophila]QYJ87993.1 MerR family DNA-binding protein [Shewanella mesophila]
MKIGEVAKQTGLSVKSIRYYHDIGLVCAERGANGYRSYGTAQIDELHFLHHCRELGFTLEDCRALLSLKSDKSRSAEDVKQIANIHLQEVNRRIAQLHNLKQQLSELIHACAGGEQPDCAILKELSAKSPTSS